MIQINVPFLLLLLLAALAAVLTWVWYRHTHPVIEEGIRYILSALRFLVILGLLLLIFKPRIDYWRERDFLPRLAVYIDNSGSMDIESPVENRPQILKHTMSRLKELLPGREQIRWFNFNTNISPVTGDSISPSVAGTDFNIPLDHFVKNGFEQAIIVSDGNHTAGAYPLQGRDFPGRQIFTIGIGSTLSREDIVIRDVRYPPVGYQGQPQKLKILFGGTGLKNSVEKRLLLRSGNRIIDQKNVTLLPGDATGEVELELTPANLGLINYRLELESLKNEQNTANNRFIFVQEVLKRQLKITLLSGAPDFDTKFINIVLGEEPDFRVIKLVQKTGSRFYGNLLLRQADSSDVIIVKDYPDGRTAATMVEELNSILQSADPSLLFIFSENSVQMATAFRSQLQQLVESVTAIAPTDLNPVITPVEGSERAIVNIYDNAATNQLFWNSLPPIQTARRFIPVKGSETLLQGSRAGILTPLILIRESTSRKLALMNGTGYWRWHFLLRNDETLSGGFRQFITHLMRWLADKRRTQTFRIDTDKKVYYQGEAVNISATLLGGDYRPVRDGRVELNINWGEQSFKQEAVADSLGIYRTRFIPPDQGRFRIEGKAYRNAEVLGENETQLEVIPYNPELNRISLNDDFLRKLSSVGNGRYFSVAEMDTLSRFPGRQAQKISEKVELELWFKSTFLILLIVFISLEWYLRKHHGLV